MELVFFTTFVVFVVQIYLHPTVYCLSLPKYRNNDQSTLHSLATIERVHESFKTAVLSPVAMDSLATLNIVPFLGLMNLVEVRYLHMPEVYHTMLAILCDYDPVSQDNIIRTRRYLSVLLAREPDLAQCLLNFIDTPEESTSTSVATDESKISHHGTTQGPPSQFTNKKPFDNTQHGTALTPKCVPSEQMGDFQSSEMRAVQTSDSNKCSMNTQTLTTVPRQTDILTDFFSAEVPKQMGFHPPSEVSDSQKNLSCYNDKMLKNVPLVNIYHKDIFTSGKSTASAPTVTQQQSAPFFLPRFLASQLNAPDQAQTLIADKRRDQTTFTPTPTHISGQPQAEASSSSATFETQVTDRSPFSIKHGRQCRVAQTQTLTTTNLHDSTSTNETPVPVKLSKTTHDVSGSSSDPLMTMATLASHPSVVTPSICLSKLLGQPSVAYLPATHFINNHNSIIGGASACKSTDGENLPYNSSIVSVKMNSAAAKLHVLSTQAGNEKTGSLQEGYGNAVATATSSFGSLSAPVPSNLKDSRIKTTVKLSSKSGCRKMITLSQMVPMLKHDTVQDPSDTKMNTMSYDKQIQVGQRQICKKSKTSIGKKEEVCQMYSQLTNHPNSQEEPPDQQSDKELSADQKKNTSVFQPTNQNSSENDPEIKRLLQSRKETQKFSVNQHKCQITKKTRASKQRHQNNDTFLEKESKSGKSPVGKQNQATEKLLEDPEDHQTLPENQENRWLMLSQEHKSWTPTSHVVPSDKHKQESGNVMSTKPTAPKQMVQVVEVSNIGSSPSLSAFPYIQQMILPDGQVSMIAHNSHTAPAPLQRSGQQMNNSACVSYSTKPSATVGGYRTVKKPTSSKQTTQIVLPRNQLKLSVSIQTPVKNANTSAKKQMQTSNQPYLKNNSLTTEATQMSSNTATTENDVPCNVSLGKNTPADASNLLNDAQCSGNSQGKRKRSSPLCRRNTTAKTMKLRF